MIERKPWSKYTAQEIEQMRVAVMYAPPETPFTPEYAAAYLGKSSSTLQYIRSHRPNEIEYSKVGGHVRYIKKHLDEYLAKSTRSIA